MSHAPTPTRVGPGTGLLRDHSVEVTVRDHEAFLADADRVAAGTRVHITSLAHESASDRVRAAGAVRVAGHVPVPHVAARRLGSRGELADLLLRLADVDATASLCLVAGDPAQPAGPYADSASVIRTGLLARHGVRDVTVAGYPEGHPRISDHRLLDALREKTALLAEQGCTATVVTQFSFDAERVLGWVAALRRAGIHAPVRVGTPGRTSVRRLLTLAARFGVASSASIVQKYGFSLTNLLGSAGPERFVQALADGLGPEHGTVRLHLYTFGGAPTLLPT